MEKKLGRGIEALIPVDNSAMRERVQMLNVDQVYASRFQPRLNFSQEKIEELAKSIQEKGVIQPILVRSGENNQFELIAGERRLRAVKHLGVAEIPAIVRRVPDADLLEISIVENIQREELNALDEAKAYRRLAQEFGYSQEHIATRVGKDKSSISNLLRILSLPDKIQEYLSANLITLGHAKALLSLGDTKSQISYCEAIIKRGLSVREIELISSRRLKARSPRVRNQNNDLKSIENRLEHHLGTKVRIRHGRKRGRIEIDYYSLEDLERILKLIATAPESGTY